MQALASNSRDAFLEEEAQLRERRTLAPCHAIYEYIAVRVDVECEYAGLARVNFAANVLAEYHRTGSETDHRDCADGG